MRKPRNANRGTLQNIEDEFCDLDVSAQARMLETLAGLHRQAQRMQRKKEPEPVVDSRQLSAAFVDGTMAYRAPEDHEQ